METTHSTNPPTDKQIAYLTRLVAERSEVTDERQRAEVDTIQTLIENGKLNKRSASAAIDILHGIRPVRSEPTSTRQVRQGATNSTGTALDLSGILSGRYAVPGGDTRLKVQVDAPTRGKWAGWVFVKDAAVYGQGRRYGRQRPGGTYEGMIVPELTAIVKDPRAAAAAYGRLTSTCGMCGRALEDAASVERGIGPVCAEKF